MSKRLSDVLVINSYAGSLTIAAMTRGHRVLGSYEDAGYGLEVQRHNYPQLDYRKKLADWDPRPDLSRALVIAHPPCAAFSTQNNASSTARGINAPKFQCTRRILEYGLGNGCVAMAVESVVAALEGAREVHDHYAERHGYHVFRVLQNAATFGLPQWRPRFWCLFMRKDVAGELLVEHAPVAARVGDVLEDEPSEAGERFARAFDEQRSRLAARFGRAEANKILRGERGFGRLPNLLAKMLKRDMGEVSRELCVFGQFQSNTLRVLDEDGLAPTVTGTAFLAARGRLLSDREYQRLMGFPDAYRFPDSARKHQKFYLARGVCPPIAAWVLDTMERNATARRSYHAGRRLKDGVQVCQPSATVNVSPVKRAAWNALVASGAEA